MTDRHEKRAYWEAFYSSNETKKLAAPSQFAAFVAQEAGDSIVIEIGCGSGRDSVFFARQGFHVIGIDGSRAAIDHCERLKQQVGVGSVSFIHASVGEPEFASTLSAVRQAHSGRALVYARFFLHAVTEPEEEAFFEDVAASMRPGDMLALEFRTVRDAVGAKVTATHYRRYVEPWKVFANAGRLGFLVDYAVEGFGFAKYREDDAYVARCILRRT